MLQLLQHVTSEVQSNLGCEPGYHRCCCRHTRISATCMLMVAASKPIRADSSCEASSRGLLGETASSYTMYDCCNCSGSSDAARYDHVLCCAVDFVGAGCDFAAA